MSKKQIVARDLVFVDLETTGLNPQVHEIIEMAVLRVRQEWQDGEKPSFTLLSEWSVKVRPEHIADADPIALKVSGYSTEKWNDAISLEEAITIFAEKVKDGIMVAHNVVFDAEFIDTALFRYGIANTMHYHRIDTVSMAFAVLHNTPDVNRYSLNELCKYFSITNDHPHEALSDARADFELFKRLLAYE